MLWITLLCMVTIEEKPAILACVIPAITRTWRVLINFTRRRSEDYMDEKAQCFTLITHVIQMPVAPRRPQKGYDTSFVQFPSYSYFVIDQFSVLIRINKIWFGLYEELFIIPI